MALSFAPLGKKVKITNIQTNEKTKRHLENLGLIVGSQIISLFDGGGDVVIKIKDCKLALNKSLANKILVSEL